MELRNLDQIRERDSVGGARLGHWLLGAAGAGALGVALYHGVEAERPMLESTQDPLGELIAETLASTEREAQLSPTRLVPGEASFAQVLVDREAASTAHAAVKDEQGRLIPPLAPTATGDEPPASAPELAPPSIAELLPTPARIQTDQDPLMRLAEADSTVPPRKPSRTPGPGHYQIQVSSFLRVGDAQRLVRQLRRRGYPAHIETARVRGENWHRVRLGPYVERSVALARKRDFEAREAMATLLVDPAKLRRQAQAIERAQRD